MFRNYPPTIDDEWLTDEEFKVITYYKTLLEKEKIDSSLARQIPVRTDKTKKICGIIKARLHQDNYSEELKLYHKLLNEEFGFMYKTIEFDEQKGLKVVPIYDGDPELDVTRLSSGEKKLIILFYTLLFESTLPGKNSSQTIFLIDEPETSLHIDWQQNLIKNIMKICKDKDIQVIVATHSPDIVDEYWGLQSEMISARFKSE